MKRRLRALCLTVAGLLAAVTPLLITQQPASAAVYKAQNEAQITFIDRNGQGHTCSLGDYATHNTDDPSQPYTYGQASTVISQEAGPCQTNVFLEVTVNYKDKDGVARHAIANSFSAGLSLQAFGTFSAVTVTSTANFGDCNPDASATCDISLTVSPK